MGNTLSPSTLSISICRVIGVQDLSWTTGVQTLVWQDSKFDNAMSKRKEGTSPIYAKVFVYEKLLPRWVC